jgi:hypothetical protein
MQQKQNTRKDHNRQSNSSQISSMVYLITNSPLPDSGFNPIYEDLPVISSKNIRSLGRDGTIIYAISSNQKLY